ncbi:CoA-binding protein [Candidatus Sumerlaeota bacterium]|nr:CoA-binding protein [Candidatus Sumerlaeota bacterium]
MNVAVLGASNKPQRYSYKAVQALLDKGHNPFPVHPVIKQIDSLDVYASLNDVPEPVDTITVYLSAANSDRHADDMLTSGARRVIFNPGAENPELAASLQAAGIEAIEACTLVMLSTNQF